MGLPIVEAANGIGWPVTEAANGYGLPVTVAANGYGRPVVYVASGGYPVVTEGGAGGIGLPALSMNFIQGFGQSGGSITPVALMLTTIRATPPLAYSDSVAGLWTSFPPSIPRITDKGLLVEEARTNVVLWSRDLSNAAWVKSNLTATLDQTGVDGVANSASRLLATSPNGTILQTITLVSSARWQSAFVKRIQGTGTVEMTMDNGTTWTAVTVTDAWTRVSIPTQTLANPIVGLRLAFPSDQIAVDFVQNENGAFVTSPIPTTTVAVTRAADEVRINHAFGAAYTLFAEVTPQAPATYGTAQIVMQAGPAANRLLMRREATNGGRLAVLSGGTGGTILSTVGGFATDVRSRWATAVAAGDQASGFDGGAPTTATIAVLPTSPTVLYLGINDANTSLLNGRLARVSVWNTRLTNAQLQALTGGASSSLVNEMAGLGVPYPLADHLARTFVPSVP